MPAGERLPQYVMTAPAIEAGRQRPEGLGSAPDGASRERGRPGEGRGAQLTLHLIIAAGRIVAKEIAERPAGDGGDIGIAGSFDIFDEFGESRERAATHTQVRTLPNTLSSKSATRPSSLTCFMPRTWVSIEFICVWSATI